MQYVWDNFISFSFIAIISYIFKFSLFHITLGNAFFHPMFSSSFLQKPFPYQFLIMQRFQSQENCVHSCHFIFRLQVTYPGNQLCSGRINLRLCNFSFEMGILPLQKPNFKKIYIVKGFVLFVTDEKASSISLSRTKSLLQMEITELFMMVAPSCFS